MDFLIQNARVLDPSRGVDCHTDVLIHNGKIEKYGDLQREGTRTLNARGLCLAPGLIDLHVHLRDPGQTYKEELSTGCAAAAAGGFTAVACMPNTKPVCDTPEAVRMLLERAARLGLVRLLPIAAVTVGEQGQTLTDFDALRAAGAAAFSDDGVPVMRADLMCEALRRAKRLGAAVSAHEEDATLVGNRACNEGHISERLGLPGRPAVAEELMADRDVRLAAYTGGHVHIAHVSTAGTANIIRRAKAAGIPVTAETCPQYFTFTEELLLEKGALARVNPPLRTERDRQEILAAVIDRTIDCIVTDHAPHSAEEKTRLLPDAPSGMVGLETSLAASLTVLHHGAGMPLLRLLESMSTAPARAFGVRGGTIAPGADADLVLFDPDEEWIVDPSAFRSKGRNTPFGGMTLKGRVKATFLGGKPTFQAPDCVIE